MTHARHAVAIAALLAAACAHAQSDTVDMAQARLDAKDIVEGLFPEDACDQLKAAGFKCMGFKPAVRYSMPANAFKVGSAEVPDSLKRDYLDKFAEALRSHRGSGKQVRIEGHADASGAAATNMTLSQKRAEAVKDYLVERGADSSMLVPVGVGANNLKNVRDPFAAENRRVEIGRDTPPS